MAADCSCGASGRGVHGTVNEPCGARAAAATGQAVVRGAQEWLENVLKLSGWGAARVLCRLSSQRPDRTCHLRRVRRALLHQLSSRRCAKMARASSQVLWLSATCGFPLGELLQECKDGSNELSVFLARGAAGAFAASEFWVTCRNGSSEFLGLFGKSNVRFCVERTLERARWPDACIAGRSRYAFQSLLHVILLVRVILARYFLKTASKFV